MACSMALSYGPTPCAPAGLKHQIRVHLADGLGCPVFGDHKFSGPLLREDEALRRKLEAMNLDRDHFYLHALSIGIDSYHGQDKPPFQIKAPLPDYYTKAIKQLHLKFVVSADH